MVLSMNNKEIVGEVMELLTKYQHECTEDGVGKIVRTWFDNKYELMETLSKHPLYNGRGQIILRSTDFSREVDKEQVRAFFDWLLCRIIEDEKSNDALIRTLHELKRYFSSTLAMENTHIETAKSCLESVNSTVKPHEGEKTSRFVRKLCKAYGWDKFEGFEKEYAKYADAINPTIVKRTTVISVNPLDYLTMSFGNSWASCHTIDKNNVREKPNSYEGQYCSGTLSYMLDETSVVVYTLPDNYEGKPEEQEKITRCMFHYGEDKLIQGRMYPQTNDGNCEVSKELRMIVQKVFAECLDIPNYWIVKKGTDCCEEYIESEGTHYRDYEHFETCNVSIPKGKENRETIIVGHDPICPCCGCEHQDSEHLLCEDCDESHLYCYDCGRLISEDEVYWIDGEAYCCDCVTYCDFHREYELNRYNSFVEVSGYGIVCEDGRDRGIEEGTFDVCNGCGDVYCSEDGVMTEDGTFYCCESCAEYDGYVYSEKFGGWFLEDELEEMEKETAFEEITMNMRDYAVDDYGMILDDKTKEEASSLSA